MQAFARLAVLLSGVVAVIAESSAILAAPYSGTKVFRVPTGNESSLIQYDELIQKLALPTWTDAAKTDSHIDVEVAAEFIDEFTTTVDSIIASHGIAQPLITMHEDLGASIEAETTGMFDEVSTLAVNETWFNAYHTYADHVSFFTQLQAQFPNNSKIVSAGKSLEGRDLFGIQIYGSSGPDVKPAIVYQSTVHAREWITTMVNEYIAFKLLTAYTGESKTYVDSYDFFIFPFTNPDGFVFTQSTTRLWRKNRKPAPSGSSCLGVDINRNWAHSSWSQSSGASTSPCAEDYKGASSGSETETKAWSAWITARQAVGAGVIAFMDWHSYSQLAMYPYGYTCSKTPTDNSEFSTIMSAFTKAVKAVNNVTFDYGGVCNTIYQVSGDSIDWAYENAKIKYAFTVELRDTGANGFVLPASQILPSGTEIWAGVKTMWTAFKV